MEGPSGEEQQEAGQEEDVTNADDVLDVEGADPEKDAFRAFAIAITTCGLSNGSGTSYDNPESGESDLASNADDEEGGGNGSAAFESLETVSLTLSMIASITSGLSNSEN